MANSGEQLKSISLLTVIPPETAHAESIRAAIEATVPLETVAVCATLDGLARRLKTPDPSRLAALVVATSGLLPALLEMQELLEDQRLLLVMPGADAASIAQAHQLRPRLLLHTQEHLDNLPAFLEKLMGTKKNGAP